MKKENNNAEEESFTIVKGWMVTDGNNSYLSVDKPIKHMGMWLTRELRGIKIKKVFPGMEVDGGPYEAEIYVHPLNND